MFNIKLKSLFLSSSSFDVSFIYCKRFVFDFESKLFKLLIILFILSLFSFLSLFSLTLFPPNIFINPSSFSLFDKISFKVFNFSSLFGVLLFSFRYFIISCFLSLSNLFIILTNLLIPSSLSSSFFVSSLNISFIFFFCSSSGINSIVSFSILLKNSFSFLSLLESHKSTVLFNISFFLGFLLFSIIWLIPSFIIFLSIKSFNLSIWFFLTSLSALFLKVDNAFFFSLLFFNPFTYW